MLLWDINENSDVSVKYNFVLNERIGWLQNLLYWVHKIIIFAYLNLPESTIALHVQDMA